MSRPLASLGLSEIAVFQRLRIAILSTGEELVSLSTVMKEHLVKDANGPFLETALRNRGVEAQFWGVIGDGGCSFVELVSNNASTRECRRPRQHRRGIDGQVRFCGSWS
jgi:molybdopterin biosynthesis enzyme